MKLREDAVWRKICETVSILLSSLSSIFTALLVNYIANFLRNAKTMDSYDLFLNISIIISSLLIVYNIIGLNIKLLKSERLQNKIEKISDIDTVKWIFNNSYTDEVKNRIIDLYLCCFALLLCIIVMPLLFYILKL
jgi:hypothetical protein